MIHKVEVNSDGSTDTRELSVSMGDIVELWVDNMAITHLYVAEGTVTCAECPLHKSVQNIKCPMNYGYPLCYGYIESIPGFIRFKEISLEEL